MARAMFIVYLYQILVSQCMCAAPRHKDVLHAVEVELVVEVPSGVLSECNPVSVIDGVFGPSVYDYVNLASRDLQHGSVGPLVRLSLPDAVPLT